MGLASGGGRTLSSAQAARPCQWHLRHRWAWGAGLHAQLSGPGPGPGLRPTVTHPLEGSIPPFRLPARAPGKAVKASLPWPLSFGLWQWEPRGVHGSARQGTFEPRKPTFRLRPGQLGPTTLGPDLSMRRSKLILTAIFLPAPRPWSAGAVRPPRGRGLWRPPTQGPRPALGPEAHSPCFTGLRSCSCPPPVTSR